MSGRVKIGSVIACVVVIVMCCIYYTVHISNAIYNISSRNPAVKVEDCSAKIADAAPEGYYVYYYGDEEDLADMEVVEVTWLLSNHTNNKVDIDEFWADYDSVAGFYLYRMRKETEDLAVPNYENRKILPPGEQASFKEYVLVPKGLHEIEVTPGYMATPAGSDRETFTITF